MIFPSRRSRAAFKHHRLKQQYITPFTAEQTGIIDRFARTLN
jgi:putative transposase